MRTAHFSDSGWGSSGDPLEGTWDEAARHEVTSYRDPPPLWTTPVTLPCPKLRLRTGTTKFVTVKLFIPFQIAFSLFLRSAYILALVRYYHNCYQSNG